MSLKKQYLKSKPICKVTFSLDKKVAENAEKIQILGSFNYWIIDEATTMKKFKNGNFKATIDLPIEAEYEFKYLVDGSSWLYDESADKYVNNRISAEDNSMISI